MSCRKDSGTMICARYRSPLDKTSMWTRRPNSMQIRPSRKAIRGRQVGVNKVGIGIIGVRTGPIPQLRNWPPEQTVNRIVAIGIGGIE
eukprot:scaffold503665_cov67-Attheya_sp.AAC.1